MFDSKFFARTALVTAGCAVAAASVGIGPASAQASTTVSPAGAAVQATNQGVFKAVAGGVTITCNTSTASGNVPAAPGNTNPSGPVTVPINAPTFTGCSTSMWGVSATVTTSGSWSITGQNGSPVTGTINIPTGGMVIQTSGFASCKVVVAPTGPASLAGTWTNGTPSTVQATNSPAPIKVTGSWGCPTSATTGSVTGTYQVTNTTTPSVPITVGP